MSDAPTDVQEEGPVIRDKRRLDPETGQVRESTATSSAPAGPTDGAAAAPAATASDVDENGADAGVDPHADAGVEPGAGAAEDLGAQLAERTADLQRLQAEYANYRRRVERDREAVKETVLANVLTHLLPVLDDIGRAREHGELEGGFKSVGEALEQTVERLGLERFGAEGDAFDPTVHEALTHSHSDEVTDPTCTQVFQPGYRIGERVVRPARVAVADPA